MTISSPIFKILAFVVALYFQLGILTAQEETYNFDDFLEMSLEDLMSIEIVTKTQSEENLQLPFSSFFIVTEKEIIENGFVTLGQLLESVPGISVVDNGFYSTGGQRGLNGNFSQSLILLNGREINGLYSGQTFIANQFATNNIKQVEITQGPGTVLYGSDSFAGIINIVTKDYPINPSKIEVHADIGSVNWQSFDLLFTKKRDLFKMEGYARLYSSDGFDYASFVEQDSFVTREPNFSNGINYNNRRFDNGSESINYHAKASYGPVYVGRDFYSVLSEQKGIQFLSLDYNAANGQTSNLSVNYAGLNYDIKENSSLLIEYQFTNEKIWGVDRNHEVNQPLFNSIFAQGDDPLSIDQIYSSFTRFYSQRNSEGSKKSRLKFEYTSRIASKSELDFWKGDWYFTLGNSFDNYNILELANSNNIPHPDHNSETTSDRLLGLPIFQFSRNETYGQLRKSIFAEKVFLTLGARYSQHENFAGKPILRSGLVVNLLNNSYLKASFSQGRRFPTVNELILGSFGEDALPNFEIEPANLNSLDIGYSQRFSKDFFWELNAYSLNVEKQIIPTGPFSWENREDDLSIFGLETQVNFSRKKLNWQLSYAFKDASDQTNIYRHAGFASVGYKILPLLNLNTTAVFKSKLLSEDGSPNVFENFEIPSHVSLNMNLSSREIFIKGVKISVMATLKNILNSQQQTPNLLQSGPRSFVNPGRQFFARLIINV